MASILKVACGSQIYRVVLPDSFDFASVDSAVRRVLPDSAAADATFADGSEPRALSPDAFSAFAETGKKLTNGQVLLRLDVAKPAEEPQPPAMPQPPATPHRVPTAVETQPTRSRKQAVAAWQEDPRPLDELVKCLQPDEPGKKTRTKAKRCTKKASRATVASNAAGENGVESTDTYVGPKPGGDARDAPSQVAAQEELAKDECPSSESDEIGERKLAATAGEEYDPEDPLPCGRAPTPKELFRSSSCPARTLVPVLLPKQAAQDLPQEPMKVWPPTPDLTPPQSPRMGGSELDKDGLSSCGGCETSDEKLAAIEGEEEYEEEDDPLPSRLPPTPTALFRSFSCPPRTLPPEPQAAFPEQALLDLPEEPAELWPPTPESTPPQSPRMPCFGQQQLVWVPVLVPVF